ncbi:INO80 complex subunit D-B [Electrophorus electricus]|uniref:KANL2-like probable zinc-finger domain-containing protein n=1 Tax=Electrophorus electricus TaxID=8005 RepID=A0A4W4GZN1_ELEEL|nr:INO80 complex subunit D-B [Electrophorus electricus]XP_035383614.1 INO80 complex subunit D-B [Electrophorus electricus]
MYEGKHIHYSEVDHKPLCSYSPKLCKQRRLNGYAFCIRHVLEDRTAPFRQCEYVAKYNSQRCTNPIPKTQDRRFCSSHLQVMGILPKKERKKKQDALESVALNITVPSLALKTPNGLERLTPSSPSPLACLLPLAPYAFCKGEKAKKDGSSLGKRPLSRPAPNPRQKPKDHAAVPGISPLFPSTCRLHPPPSQNGGPGQMSVGPTSSPAPNSQPPRPFLGLQGMMAPAQTARHTLTRPIVSNLEPERLSEPVLAKITLPTTPGTCGEPVMVPSDPVRPPAHCLLQLQRLMEQQRRKHEDLSPNLGLDWSEDSEEDDESLVQRVVSYQYQSLQDKQCESTGAGISRGERLAGLCSYLKHRHTHLYREVRGYRRARRADHTLHRALLQAATQDPDRTAQLIQMGRTEVTATSSSAGSWTGVSHSGLCVAQVNGKACTNQCLPLTRHCFQHILQSGNQHLFSSCTARFADGAQCSIPVLDITHQTPLCEEHAKKMDNFLCGDVRRRTYHRHQQLQQCRRLKKTKLPALSRKHKKKGRRGAICRPQKPIPPALPQGIKGVPSILCLSTQPKGIRSPLTPDLSADEFPDDITSDISDIPHDLELNQEDFSDVLPRFPDDLQDFDLFEGKTSELLPTSEETEELVRVLQAMGSYPESLACLSGMTELGPVEGSDCRGMEGCVVDLLSARLSAETLSNLELDPSLLPATEDAFPPSPASPQPPLTPPSSVGYMADGLPPQVQPPCHLLPKTDNPRQDLLPLTRDEDISHGSWGVLALPISDVSSFHSLITSDGLLMSTTLATPLTPTQSAPCQPPATLSNLPESSLTIPATALSSASSSPSAPRVDLLRPGQLKHPLPPLLNHCRIPADLHPHLSAPAPTVDRT